MLTNIITAPSYTWDIPITSIYTQNTKHFTPLFKNERKRKLHIPVIKKKKIIIKNSTKNKNDLVKQIE